MNETFNRPAPPGFEGLKDDGSQRKYRRLLPHWRQPGATYFITFRLGDSLPAARLRELDDVRRRMKNRPADERQREVVRRIERWLDLGSGACPLGKPRCGAIVGDALRYFHGERYELGCFVVMPNHVHVIVRPFPGERDPVGPAKPGDEMENTLHSWKSYTSNLINERLGRSGPLWQQETFDRIVRDEGHLWRCVQYIGANPGKATLRDGESLLWFNPEWVRLGWTFRP